MATAIIDITDDWIDIKSDQSLNETSTYLIQNTGASTMYLSENGTEPAASDEGHIIPSGDTWSFTVGPLALWLRSDDAVGEYTITEG